MAAILRRHTTILQPNRRAFSPSLSKRAIFSSSSNSETQKREISRLSQVWFPTSGITPTSEEDGYGKLVRSGYIRQSHSGLFQLLPLGLRVQDKLEKLLGKHMQSLGASQVSLSSITTESLWQKSGRLSNVSSELFKFKDRKGVPYMLSPTHEEEITTLVSQAVKSYKDLPLRLYQITRKYRDEPRPRHGLLRSREFLMKDMYTFDSTREAALSTYQKVQAAYANFFAALKIPYIVAEASSGAMGGDLNHEYHLLSPIGEDTVVFCNNCDYAANDEVAHARQILPADFDDMQLSENPNHGSTEADDFGVGVWRGISRDRNVLVNVWYPRLVRNGSLEEPLHRITSRDINTHALKAVFPDLDASVDEAVDLWPAALSPMGSNSASHPNQVKLLNIVDFRLLATIPEELISGRTQLPVIPPGIASSLQIEQSTVTTSSNGSPLDLLRIRDGDGCPRCSTGTLTVRKALELGHTFHLGTRYSEPLGARVALPTAQSGQTDQTGVLTGAADPNAGVPIQMGCYGVGISRIIGSVAEHLADSRGLNWPRAMAPYEVAVLPSEDVGDAAIEVSDALAGHPSALDVILDDRQRSLVWKMKDADLAGFPVIVILGKAWKRDRSCEVQCRRLSVKENIPIADLPARICGLLEEL